MRSDKIKQVITVSENNAADFQLRMNEALSNLSNPEIVFDPNRSFTAVIIYSVLRDVPEDLLELLELMDGDSHCCGECPHYIKSEDKRRKYGSCSRKADRTRADSRACELYYIERRRELQPVIEEYKQLPFVAE